MHKRRSLAILACLMSMTLLTSCGMIDNLKALAGPATRDTEPEVTDATDDAASADTDDTAADTTAADTAEAAADDTGYADVDITSEDAIYDFLDGEWYMADLYNWDDFGKLTISADGSLTYERLTDNRTVDGRIELCHPTEMYYDIEDPRAAEVYTGYKISMTDIPSNFDFPGQDNFTPDEDETSGCFYIGTGAGEDYLYLSFVGNGDTYITNNIFQNSDRIAKAHAKTGEYPAQYQWVLHRKSAAGNSGSDTDSSDAYDGIPPKTGRFYAWVWGNTGGDLLLQPMDCMSYESYEDYTNRHYTAGLFCEDDSIALGKYRVADDVNARVFNTLKLSGRYPLMMCEVVTDTQGVVAGIEEVSSAFYGLYDMGDLEPEYSYDGLVVTYNGVEYDLEDYDTTSNAIMDIYEAGEWLVIDTHVNPHYGNYYLLNIYTGDIERRIEGANLTWRGDDLTTAVYSMYDTLYNFKGNVLGTTDGTEIYDVYFSEDGPMVCAKDFNDAEYWFDEANGDEAMYHYATYRRHSTAKTWADYMAYVPRDVNAMVIVNPPVDVNRVMPWPEEIDSEAGDCFYVVSLFDDTTVTIEDGQMDFSGVDMRWISGSTINERTLAKGEIAGYRIVVPEGVPTRCAVIDADGVTSEFHIGTLSGESDISCAFVTE